jgi:hypothetical protein
VDQDNSGVDVEIDLSSFTIVPLTASDSRPAFACTKKTVKVFILVGGEPMSELGKVSRNQIVQSQLVPPGREVSTNRI